MLTRMTKEQHGIFLNNKKVYKEIAKFKATTIELVFDFAFKMSFGGDGEHRQYRSGGTHIRKNGEIFANTFQGQLSEFALYNALYKDFPTLEIPDLSTYGLGKWDDTDFDLDGKKISVKSTKSFGNLLLLETKDWNSQAQYIPNIVKGSSTYDFFTLVRVSPYCEEVMKSKKYLYSNHVKYHDLKAMILNESWGFDIPGFITNEQLKYAINNDFIIYKGELLNGSVKMDAENYYIQSGEMSDIKLLKDFLRRI